MQMRTASLISTGLHAAVLLFAVVTFTGKSLEATPEQIAASVLEYYRLGIHSFLLRGFENPHDTMAIGRDLIPLIKGGAEAIDRQAEAAE